MFLQPFVVRNMWSKLNIKERMMIFLAEILDITRNEVSFSNELRHYSSDFDKVPKQSDNLFSNLF